MPHELGKPFLTTWQQKDYALAGNQNWAIERDDRGVMYVGNNSGILEYDGVSWRLIELPNKTVCRSLAKDAHGRIYFGGVGDFGYLAPDSVGQMRGVSLLPQVPDDARDFGDVWETHVAQGAVYFATADYVFRWTPRAPFAGEMEGAETIKIWKPDDAFHQSNVVDDVFYVREWEKGLLRMEGDSLKLVPGGEQFANERIYVMLPFSGDRMASEGTSSPDSVNRTGVFPDHKRILVGTRTQGLFLYDGQTFHPFKTDVDAFLQEVPLYWPGAVLRGEDVMLNTNGGGAVLLDRNGTLLQTIDRSTGLPDNGVNYIYSDPARPETQWLALDNSIARVDATGPFSTFGAASGLEGIVQNITRHQGVLYVATMAGIFYLDAASRTFHMVERSAGNSWNFLAVDGELLAATETGISRINGYQATSVRPSVNHDFYSYVLHRSQQDSQRVFVGLLSGLASLRREQGIWYEEGRAPDLQDEVRTLVEMDDGTLWVGTNATGVLRLIFPGNGEDIWQGVQVERFGTQAGLPEGTVEVYEVRGSPYFETTEGLYRFDATHQRFVVDSTFVGGYWEEQWGRPLADGPTRVWLYLGAVSQGTRQADGRYQWLKAPFRHLSDQKILTLYPEENGVVWFGSNEGVIRYDSNMEINVAVHYPALVRRVVAGNDSLIYGGTDLALGTSRKEGNTTSGMEAHLEGVLPYADNNIHFAYSASSYEDASRLQFQTWLEGFDEGWSNWSDNSEKEYTNLPEGTYRFRVRAKNMYEHLSQEAVYPFAILPPWYRTWWAYGTYMLLFSGLVVAGSRVQRRRLVTKERQRAEVRETRLRAQAAEANNKALQAENERKESELQKAVELKAAYEALENAHEHLKSTQQQLIVQEKLASLGQLTAGIAHEIKNPLNFVNNFAEVNEELADELREDLAAHPEALVAVADLLVDLKQNAQIIGQHGKRADRIVKSMMQHTAIGTGQPERTNINQLVSQHLDLAYHGKRAQVEGLQVQIQRDLSDDVGTVNVIPQEIGRVLLNLLGNAFDAVHDQMTKVNGAYTPTVSASTQQFEDRVEIRVSDNGPGIPEKIQDRIFEPFFTTKPSGAGTGLGLSLSYDIITQGHGGTLTVESEEGQGATFIITLPRNNAAADADL